MFKLYSQGGFEVLLLHLEGGAVLRGRVGLVGRALLRGVLHGRRLVNQGRVMPATRGGLRVGTSVPPEDNTGRSGAAGNERG